MALVGKLKNQINYHGRPGRPIVHKTPHGRRYIMVRAKGGSIKTVAADVGDELAVKGYVDYCLSEFDAIDAIYANAGISGGIIPIQDQTPTMWEEILRVTQPAVIPKG